MSQCPSYTASYAEYKDKRKFEALSLADKRAVKANLICNYNLNITDIVSTLIDQISIHLALTG